ncbi:MAG: tetratricopeptide repeat protein, partial [Bacteroidales bacterium]|nr:tetratricopeptide repeat protein [Bacteroidales bacterium]
MKLRTLFTALLVFVTFFANAQRTQEEQMGIQYFQNGEYEKAVELFAKIYNSSPNSYIYYYYYQTLMQLGDFKEAEKVVKKQQKNSPKVQRYKIDLGFVYESSGEQEKAENVYSDAIKDLQPQQNLIRELYHAFLVRKQLNYALSTLQKGRKLLNDNKLFTAEITDIYIQLNQTDKVVAEALGLVSDKSISNVQVVETIIQKLLTDDENKQKYLT